MSVVGVLTEEVLVETVVDDEGGGGFSGHFPATESRNATPFDSLNLNAALVHDSFHTLACCYKMFDTLQGTHMTLKETLLVEGQRKSL
jgi:hypothetical protein